MTRRIVLPRRLNSGTCRGTCGAKPSSPTASTSSTSRHVGSTWIATAKPHVHPGRIRLDRRVDELASSRRIRRSRQSGPRFLALGEAEHDPVDEHVLASGISGWNPAPSSMSAEMRRRSFTVPDVGFVMPATSFNAVLLPDPLRPITPKAAAPERERRVLQRGKTSLWAQIPGCCAATSALQRREMGRRNGVPRDVRELDGFSWAGRRAWVHLRRESAQSIEAMLKDTTDRRHGQCQQPFQVAERRLVDRTQDFLSTTRRGA